MQWTDLVGMAPDDPKRNDKVGLLLVTEAHLECNAGQVISTGSQGRPSLITSHSNADVLAEELADHRSQLLARHGPRIPPIAHREEPCLPRCRSTDGNSLDPAITWAMCGSFMCRSFWPVPVQAFDPGEESPIRWPKRTHSGVLAEASKNVHRGASHFRTRMSIRATAFGGYLQSLVPTRRALVPTSRISPNRMRPVIFSCFWESQK